MKRKLEKLNLTLVEEVAALGTCERLQVGCVLTSLDGERVLAYGYNGNVRGGANTCDQNKEGACGCVHAEMNALVKPRGLEPMAAFLTCTPCLMCAKLLVNAGCNAVYSLNRYRKNDGELLLLRHQVPVKVVQRQ